MWLRNRLMRQERNSETLLSEHQSCSSVLSICLILILCISIPSNGSKDSLEQVSRTLSQEKMMNRGLLTWRATSLCPCIRMFVDLSSRPINFFSLSCSVSRSYLETMRLTSLSGDSSSPDQVELSSKSQTQQTGLMTSSGTKFMSNSTAWTSLKHSEVLIATSLSSTKSSRRSLTLWILMKKKCLENGTTGLIHSRKWSFWKQSELIRSLLRSKTLSLSKQAKHSLIHQRST